MSVAFQLQNDRDAVYCRLISQPVVTTPNYEWFACMAASWCVGRSALPDFLGLEPAQFKRLNSRYFLGYTLPEQAPSGIQADFSRMLEKDDLVNLLKLYAAVDEGDTDLLIALIVTGCLGSDHLWQDLGLWNRAQLTALMQHNFPALAAKNDKDMKWKKFLYKQLCEAEGLYLCRAPSCGVCSDYAKCYGPED